VAIQSIVNDPSLWEYAKEPDFPVLAELLLKAAADSQEVPRPMALYLLAKTLPLTKIDLADLTTDERRDAIKQFSTAFPRDRAISIISDALSDKHVEVALASATTLLDLREKLDDSNLATQIVDVLAKLTQKQFHGKTVHRYQRAQALDGLAKLTKRSAPAVPVLMELLKSDDPELKLQQDYSHGIQGDFTREKVIQTLGAIGPLAKDALPLLEAELAVLDKQAKEDTLLKGNDPQTRNQYRPSDQTITKLRAAIRSIKGSNPRQSVP
jgi:hypothetical protein